MAVDYDLFYEWACKHFGEENLKVRGSEICTHSVFAEDYKYHLWMNPTGGKTHLPHGVFRCWYSDRKGSLVSLVSELEGIDFEEAEELICGCTSLQSLNKRIEEYFGHKEEEQPPITIVTSQVKKLGLPEETYLIDDLPHWDRDYKKAAAYLNKRKIPTTGFYICVSGKYENRIIIPYYDYYGNLVYFNGRTLSNSEKVLRYMKADDKEVEQTKVMYFKTWPMPGSKVYITEGEFDSYSLVLSGLESGACGGKSISDYQTELLRSYIPVLAFDNDSEKRQDSGKKATIDCGDKLLEKGFTEVYYIRPPVGYKDWNQLFVAHDDKTIRTYIAKNERPYNTLTRQQLLIA